MMKLTGISAARTVQMKTAFGHSQEAPIRTQSGSTENGADAPSPSAEGSGRAGKYPYPNPFAQFTVYRDQETGQVQIQRFPMRD